MAKAVEREAKARQSLEALVAEHPLVKGNEKILVLGGSGQVAQYLLPELEKYYPANVLVTAYPETEAAKLGVPALSVTDENKLREMVKSNNVKVIINLAALLSGAAAKLPELSKQVNIEGPAKVMKVAEEKGVPLVFTPSSIAVLARGDNHKGVAPLDAETNGPGPYGEAKAKLESSAAAYNQRNAHKGMISACLRYGGVLSCLPKPSDGTTEQFDEAVVAAAKFAAKKAVGYLEDNAEMLYNPKIPVDSEFPMIDGYTVGTETVRYLHQLRAIIDAQTANPELNGLALNDKQKQVRDNAHRYFLAEYHMSADEVAYLLAELSPGFKMEFDESKFDDGKKRNTRAWWKKVDIDSSVKGWGQERVFPPGRSLKMHFDELVEHFTQEYTKKRAIEAQLDSVSPDSREVLVQMMQHGPNHYLLGL